MNTISHEIKAFNQALEPNDQAIADELVTIINENMALAEAKIWHRHPVWFLEGNPIVGYNRIKAGLRLMFWNGQSFDEPGLQASGSFKAAEIIYTSHDQIEPEKLKGWLLKAEKIQWDYKNIVKRKGRLERLK